MDRAAEGRCRLVGLIDSGGARIQEGVFGLGGYAEIFRRNVHYSGIVPQISLLLGPCAGGAAYSPALTDLVIMVEKQSYMFLTGPEVIRGVTGEVVDAEQLGGERPHLDQRPGPLCDPHRAGRPGCSHAGSWPTSRPITWRTAFAARRRGPTRSDEALNIWSPGLPGSLRHAAVIDNVVDRGSFLAVQGGFARNAIVGLARIAGQTVGIVAQEPVVLAGALDIDASTRSPASCASATRSISRLSPLWTPLVSCPASTRNTTASSATGPRSSTPTPLPRCPRSALSPVRPTAAPM